MRVQRMLALLLVMIAACASDEDICAFDACCDPGPCNSQPGSALPEGGELRHENVRYLGQPIQTWITVYQYTGPTVSSTAPFAVPLEGGHGQFGNCVDERSGAPSWPLNPITGATYLDLPKVQLAGRGIPGVLNIVKTDPPNMVGNSTFRHHDFTYGGGAPGNPPMGFNGTLTAEMSTPEAGYTLDIGKKDASGKVTPMTYYMPAAYTAPLGIGAKGPADPVIIPAHRDLTYAWTAPPNDFGTTGKEYTKKTYINITLFADPTNLTNPSQFICFPDSDGHATIPAVVVDALAPAGLIVNADYNHYMEARETKPGEQRRFDLVSTYGNVSPYQRQ